MDQQSVKWLILVCPPNHQEYGLSKLNVMMISTNTLYYHSSIPHWYYKLDRILIKYMIQDQIIQSKLYIQESWRMIPLFKSYPMDSDTLETINHHNILQSKEKSPREHPIPNKQHLHSAVWNYTTLSWIHREIQWKLPGIKWIMKSLHWKQDPLNWGGRDVDSQQSVLVIKQSDYLVWIQIPVSKEVPCRHYPVRQRVYA